MQVTVADKHMQSFVRCRVPLHVCQWVFGQEFPGPESPIAQQAFAVVTAMVGLCAFALVLALVEQVVLEGMEANVKRGSRVYKAGHVSATLWHKEDCQQQHAVVRWMCSAEHADVAGGRCA
jgi:hypothetical protein